MNFFLLFAIFVLSLIVFATLATKSRNRSSSKTQQQQQQLVCLSCGKSAYADIRGFLGPPSAVTSEKCNDWLMDRWQAGANIGGRIVPGNNEHMIEIGVDTSLAVRKLILDFESVWEDYYIEGRVAEEVAGVVGKWTALFDLKVHMKRQGQSFSQSQSQSQYRRQINTALALDTGAGGAKRARNVPHMVDSIKLPLPLVQKFSAIRVCFRPGGADTPGFAVSLWRVLALGSPSSQPSSS